MPSSVAVVRRPGELVDVADALAGWRLESANGISGDGRLVIGTGRNREGITEAWLARLRYLRARRRAGGGPVDEVLRPRAPPGAARTR